MPRLALLAAAALVVWVPALGACAERNEAPPPQARGPLRGWTFLRNETVPLPLPEVSHARWDEPGERRLTVSVLPRRGGEVMTAGRSWQLGKVKGVDREANLAALGSALAARCSEDDGRTASGSCRLPLMIHADRDVAWEVARDVLACVLEDPVQVTRLQWAVQARGSSRPTRQEASVSLRAVGAARLGSAPLEVALSAPDPVAAARELRLSIGDASWTCAPSEDGLASRAAFLAMLERARPHLASARPPATVVELRLPEPSTGILWHHVVQVLDLLIGSGARDIHLPGLGVDLSLPEPADLRADPFAREDDPVLTPWIVVLSALGLLLAFAVTLAPLRRRRTRPGRGRPSTTLGGDDPRRRPTA